MRVAQKTTPALALAHFRKGGMISFYADGSHAYTKKYDSEEDVRRLLWDAGDSEAPVYIVTGVSMDEVRDKLLAEFPLHQVLSVNGTEYSVRKVSRDRDEMIVSLEARENQPHAYMSVRIGFTVWEN